MTTATLPNLPSVGETRPWGLLGLFSAVLRAARRRARTPAEEQLDHLVRFSTTAFGVPLLGADDLDDLDARIEAILHGDDYWSVLRLLASIAPQLRHRGSVRRKRGLLEVLDDVNAGAAEVIAEGDALEGCIADAVEKLYGEWSDLPPEMAEALRRARPAELLYEMRIAPEVRRAVWGGHVAAVCSMGLLASQDLAPGSSAEPWWMRALAERRREGLKSALRLLASLPEVSVPTDVVPEDQRMDLGTLEARYNLGCARAAELLAAPSEGLGPEWD